MILEKDIRVVEEDEDRMKKKIEKIKGVKCEKKLMIGMIKIKEKKVEERERIKLGNIGGNEKIIIKEVDNIGEGEGRKEFVIK